MPAQHEHEVIAVGPDAGGPSLPVAIAMAGKRLAQAVGRHVPVRMIAHDRDALFTQRLDQLRIAVRVRRRPVEPRVEEKGPRLHQRGVVGPRGVPRRLAQRRVALSQGLPVSGEPFEVATDREREEHVQPASPFRRPPGDEHAVRGRESHRGDLPDRIG